MAEKISDSKGFDDTTFDTYVPELEEAADIRNALELFYYGNSEDGNATGDVSLHANLVDFDNRITANDSDISGHTGAVSDVHGIGAGHSVVGTGTAQTLTNKTLTSPTINTPTITSPSISSPTVTGTATLPSTTSIGNVSSTEISYLDGVTSSIQTQINTNTPTGMISIHSASVAPTGWLLCDGTSYGSASYTTLFNVIGYTFGGSGANFNVPNLKGRIVVGIDIAQVEFDTRGETGGAMTHQHTISAITSIGSSNHDGHGHNMNSHSHGNSISESAAGDHGHSTNQITNTGNSGNHGHSLTGSVTANNTAGRKVSSGSTSNTLQDIGHAHLDNFAVSAGGDHDHAITATNLSTNSGNHTHSVGVTNNSNNAHSAIAGGSHAHTTTVPQHTSDSLSNLQPYMALNYIIKI
jgi:microcystin-dependent protein